jgi:hypothetical protein
MSLLDIFGGNSWPVSFIVKIKTSPPGEKTCKSKLSRE